MITLAVRGGVSSHSMTIAEQPGADLPLQQQERVVIRFAGDSGDGMQITGSQFTNTSALVGNDLATLTDYPAEIRAPAGTRPGVSGFQIHFSSSDIHTPGDAPDVLVVMNPAALAVNLTDVKPGGMIIANTGNFKDVDLRKAKLETNPLLQSILLTSIRKGRSSTAGGGTYSRIVSKSCAMSLRGPSMVKSAHPSFALA